MLSALDRYFSQALRRRSGVEDERVLLGAALASRAVSQGHVALDLERAGILFEEEEEEEAPVLPGAEEWARALSAAPRLVRMPDEERRTPLVLEGHLLYLERYWDYQRSLVRSVFDRLQAQPPPIDEALLERNLNQVFNDDPRQSKQREAAALAVRERFMLLTGGPGTGKTATVVRLLALLNQQSSPPPRVALVAPSGKAAARLSESIRRTVKSWLPAEFQEHIDEEASTIHRCLGINPYRGTIKYHRENPLPYDVVIVDEASMVDLPLMTKLFQATPSGARLILLGDPDQLVSVEMGAVLGDVAAAKGLQAHRVHLTETWRYANRDGGGIQALAEAINAGRVGEALAAFDRYPELDRLESECWRAQLVLEPYRAVVEAASPEQALEALARFRVLCAHRRGYYGADRLNRQIEGWLLQAGVISLDQPWYHGRPIMVVKNDSRVKLYNGDVGVVFEGRVVFPGAGGRVREFNPAVLPEHQTVYATTVHKSQGSEYERVLVVLPDELSPVVTRQLLYTAVTRASQAVTVVGPKEVFGGGVERVVSRVSGLRAALAQH